MDQNIAFAKKYYAYDMAAMYFDFDEAYEFLYVVESEEVNNFANEHYLFYKPGEIFDFKKIKTSGIWNPNLKLKEEMEEILRQYPIRYETQQLCSGTWNKHFLWLNENGYLLHKNPGGWPASQVWKCGFAPGFKTVGGKYALNKIKAFDAEQLFYNNCVLSENDLNETKEDFVNQFFQQNCFAAYSEKLAKQLLPEYADISKDELLEVFLFLRTHFYEVKLWGNAGSVLSVAGEDEMPERMAVIFGAGDARYKRNRELTMTFAEKEADGFSHKKNYRFLWEQPEDMDTYLLGYIKADTCEKQKNFIAKCLMFGKVHEYKGINTLEWEDLDEEE